jgi:hypothetical protein
MPLVHLDHAVRFGIGWSETAGLPLERRSPATAASGRPTAEAVVWAGGSKSGEAAVARQPAP